MVQEAAENAAVKYRCPFCPPAGLNSPLLKMMLKTKEYNDRGLLVHLRNHHPDCDTDLLPVVLRERARKLQQRWSERRAAVRP